MQWEILSRFSFILNFRHQIQHYTNQLAKDTSKQLKDLNNFPPERSLDPRYHYYFVQEQELWIKIN